MQITIKSDIVTLMITHSEKIECALTALKVARPREIIAWIETHYDEKINVESYRADLMGLAVNHSSSRHSPGVQKILWFNEDKTYRLATPEERRSFKASQNMADEKESTDVEGTFTSRLSASGQIVLPVKIREKMQFKAGDLLAFVINGQGVLELRKARLKLEFL